MIDDITKDKALTLFILVQVQTNIRLLILINKELKYNI